MYWIESMPKDVEEIKVDEEWRENTATKCVAQMTRQAAHLVETEEGDVRCLCEGESIKGRILMTMQVSKKKDTVDEPEDVSMRIEEEELEAKLERIRQEQEKKHSRR